MRTTIIIGLTALAVMGPSGARAQTEQAIAEARLSFERGEGLFAEENYALALEAFEHSYALLDGFPRQHLVLFNVARCQEELGRHRAAVETFERYLEEGGASEENAAETRRRITELRRRIEMADADGRGPDEDAAPASGGDDGLLIAGVVLEAVGGAAGIASLATGLAAHDIYTSLEARCVPADNCPDGSASDISTGDTLAWTSTILLPVAVTAVGVGTALLIVAATSGGGEDTAGLELLPTPGGLRLRGRF